MQMWKNMNTNNKNCTPSYVWSWQLGTSLPHLRVIVMYSGEMCLWVGSACGGLCIPYERTCEPSGYWRETARKWGQVQKAHSVSESIGSVHLPNRFCFLQLSRLRSETMRKMWRDTIPSFSFSAFHVSEFHTRRFIPKWQNHYRTVE